MSAQKSQTLKVNKTENNKKTIVKGEKGQALLFVVVAVTIALAVGISVSTRTLNLTKRVSRSDTATRVIAASEGGIERLMGESDVFLNSLATPNPVCNSPWVPYPDGKCAIEFAPTPGDNITARAIVDAEKFRLNETDDYWFNLDPGYVKEINLSDYPSGTGVSYTPDSIDICWDNAGAAIYYLSYNANGDIKKGGFNAESFPNKSKVAGFISKGAGRGYAVCGTIRKGNELVSNAYGLRIKTLYASTKVAVFPSGDLSKFPYQGYKLISKGELKVGDEVKDVKIINAYRSYSYIPSVFDYGLYTPGALQ